MNQESGPQIDVIVGDSISISVSGSGTDDLEDISETVDDKLYLALNSVKELRKTRTQNDTTEPNKDHSVR